MISGSLSFFSRREWRDVWIWWEISQRRTCRELDYRRNSRDLRQEWYRRVQLECWKQHVWAIRVKREQLSHVQIPHRVVQTTTIIATRGGENNEREKRNHTLLSQLQSIRVMTFEVFIFFLVYSFFFSYIIFFFFR